MKTLTPLAILLATMLGSAVSHASDDHAHEDDHTEKSSEPHAHEENATTLTPAAVKASNIGTATVGEGALHQTLTLQGKLTLNPVSTAKVGARYPGTIRQVHVTVGESVKQGQPLATIHSSISLTNYTVTAPRAGTVIEVAASAGEQAAEAPLFTLANTTTLRATLQAFPREAEQLKAGQSVTLSSLSGTPIATGKIEGLLPDATSAMPLTQVVLTIENPTNQWRPGTSLIGKVSVSQKSVPLTVQTKALQTVENQTVVFVKSGDKFEARPIKTGSTNGTQTEVLEGLHAGEIYVTTNSYIIKADIEKSGAGHDH